MKLLLSALAGALAVVALGGLPAAALSCALTGDTPGIVEQTLRGERDEADGYDFMFIGMVTDVRPRSEPNSAAPPDASAWGADVDLAVSHVFRGATPARVTLFDPPTGVSGIGFVEGRRYFVAAFRDPQEGISTFLCTPTREVTDADVVRFLGIAAPSATYPDTAAPAPNPWLAPFVIAGGVLLVMAIAAFGWLPGRRNAPTARVG